MNQLTNVSIHNFKSLKEVTLHLQGLTLLSGVNSSGKSTFIQALLLVKQNQENLKKYSDFLMMLKKADQNNDKIFCDFLHKQIELIKKIPISINGDYTQLGGKKDIVREPAYEENIKIKFLMNNIEYEILIDTENLSVSINSTFPLYEVLNLFANNFQYIHTNRIQPNTIYTLSDFHIQNNLIGIHGEYTAHYLNENRHQSLKIENLKHPNAITNQLLENVSCYLSDISSGIEIKIKKYSDIQKVSLAYQYTYADTTTNDYSPLNVGFGLTYVLPIIVAILKTKPDDLLIIENPESHLHPAGQSKIAKLCALAVANGVQIIVESHSDHFLNAIRVATKQGILKAEDSVVYYFSKTSNSMETKVEEININANGSIDAYPKGFFDQFDDDLDALIEW